jgi:hypothetical protein
MMTSYTTSCQKIRAPAYDWRECGIRVGKAAGSGYGRELIERALPYQLDARTSYQLTGDGVHCSITVPLADAA